MKDLDKEPFVIVSAKTKNQSDIETFRQNHALKEYLSFHGYRYKLVSGRYNGEDEASFLLPNISEADALSIATLFNQESILVVDENREARLVFTNDSEPTSLGWFTRGESKDNFTLDGDIKYICTGAK